MPPPWEVSYPSLSRTETWSKCHGLPLAVLGTVTLLCWGPCVRAAFLAAPHAGSLTCSTTLTSRGREGSPAATKHPFPAVLSIPSPWSQTSLPRSLLASLPWVPEHLIPVVPCCPSLQSHAAHVQKCSRNGEFHRLLLPPHPWGCGTPAPSKAVPKERRCMLLSLGDKDICPQNLPSL